MVDLPFCTDHLSSHYFHIIFVSFVQTDKADKEKGNTLRLSRAVTLKHFMLTLTGYDVSV